jgi:ribosomal protein S18 acetylase RimI-like enzyme
MAHVEAREITLRDGSRACLRHASPADAAGLVDLYRRTVADGEWTLASPEEASRSVDDEVARIGACEADEGRLYLVVARATEVIGTARAEAGGYRRTAHMADVSDLWVAPGARRVGVGDALVRGLLDWARAAAQIEKLGLFVFSTSEAAIALYRRHGFVEEGRGRRDMKFDEGRYADSLMMGHFLGAAPPEAS